MSKLRSRILAFGLLAVFTASAGSMVRAAGFMRGDVDRNGMVEISDPIKLLGALFLGDPDLGCLDAADSNDSGELDVADAIYVLTYLFIGGDAPPAPFPEFGSDPTEDRLDCGEGVEWVHRWNHIAVDASGVDHTPAQPGENRTAREQFGPGRAARAMAIVHIALFEAVNSIIGGYKSYTGMAPAPAGASVEAAIAQSVHDTLVALFPSQAASIDALLAMDLARLEDGDAKTTGIQVGAQAAAAILAMRANDGSAHAEPQINIDYIPGNEPGIWRQDPISKLPSAMGARWGEVLPFVMDSAEQFRTPPPPALNSPEYTEAFNEVKRLGGDGIGTPTDRTEDGTLIGLFWAYDGTPSLCAPPRLYNQIAVQIADHMGSDTIELARMLALLNVAMADAGIGIWESKYFFKFWRPVAGIREADPGTGPTGAGDGNPDTIGDVNFSPLGAPASNMVTVNFTPPFPSYPSGHAGFGGSLFQILRKFYGTDAIAFTFISDEMNGVTRDHQGNYRPMVTRHYDNLSEAEEENGQSRIYLGIHWSFDKTEGIIQGRRIADHVFENLFRPVTDG